jgi:ATP-binding cassette subfamily B protein
MDKNELDATVLASRLGVDSKVLGESILLTGKRRDALLNSLITPKQQLPSDVAELMGHREWRTAMTTMALGMLVAQDQEPDLTATLLAPWRIPGAPVAPPQAPAAPKQAATPTATPPPTAVPVTPPAGVPAAPTPTVPRLPQAAPQAAPKPGLSQRLQKRRVPVINQMGAVECGAACLAMILSYYGRKTSVSEVRDYCGVGRDGLSALNIVKAARSYGLRVRAVSLKENDFRYVTLPAIVHWEFNHFLIVERWTPKYVDLVDPALGRRRVTAEEFDNSFTGVVIMLEPGVQFNRTSAEQHISLRTYAMNYVKLAPMSLVQIIGASLLLQIFGLIVPLLTAVAVDQIIPFKLKDTLVLLALGLFILLLAQLVTTLLRAVVLLYLQTKVDTQMMIGFFEQLLTLPLRFFQQRSSGDILTRLSSNTVIRDTISNQLVSTVLDGSFVLVYLVILLVTSPVFAGLALAIGLVQVILLLSTNHLIRDLARRELLVQGKSQGYAAEALAGIATLKSAGAEQRALQQWSNLFFDQMNASVRRSYISSLINTAMNSLRTFSPLVLLVVGTELALNGTLQVGTMLALNALAIAFLTPVASLVNSGQQLQVVHSHLERIADVMEAEPEQDVQTVRQPPRLTGHIRLDRVNFQYDPNSPPVLQDISVNIAPGQKVAIVGRTGSGKSTLGNLLLGMYLPTKGEIVYDSMPLRTLNYQAVRSQFGVVVQGSSVFNGSIRENIALNDPAMDMARIIKAAKMAAIHDDIMQMPMEYETFVSEGGSALSGGQRQRLALARALATTPVILLLDEATSALDVVTEQAIEQNLRSLPCTQIIIAHRLSTIRNADVILVIDQGMIVERGSHQELLHRNGYYARLIQSQLASGEIKAV